MAPKYNYPKPKSRFDEHGVEWVPFNKGQEKPSYPKSWWQARQALEERNRRNGF